jgi:hypothetical protein
MPRWSMTSALWWPGSSASSPTAARPRKETEMATDALRLNEIAVLIALIAEAQEVSNVALKERYVFTLTGESKQ